MGLQKSETTVVTAKLFLRGPPEVGRAEAIPPRPPLGPPEDKFTMVGIE